MAAKEGSPSLTFSLATPFLAEQRLDSVVEQRLRSGEIGGDARVEFKAPWPPEACRA